MAQGAPLRLRAESPDDLEVVAACLQDAIVATQDLRFLPDERRFAFIANRFRWEGDRSGADSEHPAERVLCAVVFDAIEGAQSRGIGLTGQPGFLELLSIAVEPRPGGSVIALTFAGGAGVRLLAARIQARVEDLTEPWPTQWRPKHE